MKDSIEREQNKFTCSAESENFRPKGNIHHLDKQTADGTVQNLEDVRGQVSDIHIFCIKKVNFREVSRLLGHPSLIFAPNS